MPFAILTAEQTIRFIVANDSFGLWIETDHASDAGRDVAEMRQAGRQVSDFDVGVRELGRVNLAASGEGFVDAVEEVPVVSFTAVVSLALLEELVLRAEKLPAATLAEQHHPIRAVERVAVLEPLLHVGRPDALFKDELPLVADLTVAGIFVDDVLRVGGTADRRRKSICRRVPRPWRDAS